MVVMGKNTLMPGRSMIISPGSLPMGNFESHGQAMPAATINTPAMMRIFCMARNSDKNFQMGKNFSPVSKTKSRYQISKTYVAQAL